jgi:hypothetical protein
VAGMEISSHTQLPIPGTETADGRQLALGAAIGTNARLAFGLHNVEAIPAADRIPILRSDDVWYESTSLAETATPPLRFANEHFDGIISPAQRVTQFLARSTFGLDGYDHITFNVKPDTRYADHSALTITSDVKGEIHNDGVTYAVGGTEFAWTTMVVALETMTQLPYTRPRHLILPNNGPTIEIP